MKQTEFKLRQTVYVETSKGLVVKTDNVGTYPIIVLFEDTNKTMDFTKDGRLYLNTTILLKHFPYEIEYKEVDSVIEIEKDTLVYYQLGSDHWDIGYYSHYDKENKKHYVIVNQKKSFETFISFSVNNISLTNPLI